MLIHFSVALFIIGVLFDFLAQWKKQRLFAAAACYNVGIQKRFGWHTFRHTYSTLLRSVGREFKVMEELLRHSSLRSTLDVYTQAISLGKHAAQAAVLAPVFASKTNSIAVP